MDFPLVLDYDWSPEGGSEAAILDAKGRLVVEGPGPDVDWTALEDLVRLANRGHEAEESAAYPRQRTAKLPREYR